jgi:tellurite resistance protein
MEEWDLRRLDATVQTAALCAYADGHLAPEERERICECVATFAASEEEAKALITLAKDLPEYCGETEKGWRREQLDQIKGALHSTEERQKAFALAVDVANAHEGIGVSETSFLLNLMTELEIEGTHARDVIKRAKRG